MYFQMNKTGIIVLMVIFLGALCAGRSARCPPGIHMWCSQDETKAKLARREVIARDRDLKIGYRGIDEKQSDAVNNQDKKREFEGYFTNY